MVVVFCQSEGAVRSFFAKRPVPFPVAIDQERAAAKAFGVYRLLGFDSVHVARPATFVLDGAGVIRSRFVATFKWQRMPIEKILEALRGLV